jgi:hypothetical protein
MGRIFLRECEPNKEKIIIVLYRVVEESDLANEWIHEGLEDLVVRKLSIS